MAKHNQVRLTLNSNIIYRVAQLPMQATLEESWPQLKESIRLSSPAFYAEIEHLAAGNLQNLTGKKKYTLQKYFNRARFRATPYGTFAGVGIFNNIDERSNEQFVVGGDQHICRFIDWPLKNNISISATELIASNAKVISNCTWYYNGDKIRYLYRNGSKFELSDIAEHPAIKQVLILTKIQTPLVKLREQLATDCATETDFAYLIGGMIELQLLYTEKQPNIIGEDYFMRNNLMPQDEKGYIVAKRPYLNGGVDKKLFKHLPDLANLFQHLTIKRDENGLQRFIQHFIKRYDRQTIPLLEALDPEMGIGYDDMEHAHDPDGFVNQFVKSKQADVNNLLKLFIAGNLPLCGTAADTVIRLEQCEVPLNPEAKPLPNTTSALLEPAGDLIQMITFGGCTATAFAGRFTLADEHIHSHCKAIAKWEQTANPNVLFFDIAYIAEDTVDNVNRRRSIYDYQLSVGNYDTSNEPLHFEDLLLFMQGQELILWSSKYNRRMIPRLATAYNYTRSDLPVFRLLCDLQYQGLTTNFNIRLRDIMPNFPFYPRLQYHNLILSPATWRLDLKTYTATGLSLPHYLQQLGVSRYLRTGTGDQTLCIDSHTSEDIELLIHLLEKGKTIYVEETIVAKGQYTGDEAGKAYASQFLLTLQHDQLIYDSVAPILRNSTVPPVNYPPGSKWLYLEIYGHPRRLDQLLHGTIKSWLRNNISLISRWFFIRYNEGGNHLRVRVQMHEVLHLQTLLPAITTTLLKEMIYDIQVKTYQPEYERYGLDMMDIVETHFYADSQYVLQLGQAYLTDLKKYQLCVQLLHAVKDAKIFPLKILRIWMDRTRSRWEREHHLEAPDFKNLNKHFRIFQSAEPQVLENEKASHTTAFISSFLHTLIKTAPLDRLSMLGNLIHMHINRMFMDNQRTHEMIVYNFAFKTFEIEQNRQAKQLL